MARYHPDRQKNNLTGKLADFSANTFVRLKLNNWLGYLLLAGIACFIAWLLVQDILLGLVFFVALLGIFLIFFCMINVQAGFYLMLSFGFFGCFISNALLKGSLPVGLVLDGLVLINFLGLLVSRKDFRQQWKTFVRRPVVIVMILSFCYGTLEMFNPNTSGASASNWLGDRKFLEFILILFTAYVLLSSYQKIRQYTFILLALSTLCALYGCIQEWHGLFPWELQAIMANPLSYALLFSGGTFRKFGTLSDPAAFGIVMAICALYFMILGIYEKNIRIRLLFFACTILMLLGMSYSGTRTAYAVILAGIVFFILLNIDRPAIQKFGVVMVFIFLALMYGPFSGVATIRRFRSTFDGTKDESYKVRIINREFIKPYIREHPIGGGMGTTGLAGAIEHPGNPLANFMPDGAYVTRAAETGWIGLLINCIVYFVILRAAIQAYFRVKDQRLKVYYAAGASCIFAFYVGDYAQNALGGPTDVGIYFAIIAMVLKQPDYDKNLETRPATEE